MRNGRKPRDNNLAYSLVVCIRVEAVVKVELVLLDILCQVHLLSDQSEKRRVRKHTWHNNLQRFVDLLELLDYQIAA